jgi:hypothetical protein
LYGRKKRGYFRIRAFGNPLKNPMAAEEITRFELLVRIREKVKYAAESGRASRVLLV